MTSLGRIDLNLFVVLEAIFNEGSITRASKTLNLSQPAVSHALARLRDLLDDQLFTRQGHRMVPTPLARQLIGPVTAGLREMSSALSQRDGFEPKTSRKHFKIGLRHTVEPAILPALAKQICNEAPGVALSTSRHDRDKLRIALASGELDVVIDALIPSMPDVSFRRLYGGKLVVTVRTDHPVLREPWGLEAYLRHDHVAASSRRSAVGYEDQILQESGRRRRIRVRCQDQWTACRLAATSDLLFTMPERFVDAFNGPLGNRVLPFPLPLPSFHIYVYWHAGAEHDPANRWLRDNIIDLYGAEPRLEG